MEDVLAVIMQLSVLVFVITSMLAMGLNLTITQIIDPLRNAKLVILAAAKAKGEILGVRRAAKI